jgi:hypothetical protein
MVLDLGTLGFERRRLHQIRYGSRRISFIKRMATALVELRGPPARTPDMEAGQEAKREYEAKPARTKPKAYSARKTATHPQHRPLPPRPDSVRNL